MDPKRETGQDPPTVSDANGRGNSRFRANGFPFEEVNTLKTSLRVSLRDGVEGRRGSASAEWLAQLQRYGRRAWHAIQLWVTLAALYVAHWLTQACRWCWQYLRLLALDAVAGIRWLAAHIAQGGVEAGLRFQAERDRRRSAKQAQARVRAQREQETDPREPRQPSLPRESRPPSPPPSLGVLASDAYQARRAREAIAEEEQRRRRESAEGVALQRLMAQRLGIEVRSESGHIEVDGIHFGARWSDARRTYDLNVLGRCPVCQAPVASGDIRDLADLGEVLADLNGGQQLCEDCRATAAATGPAIDLPVREETLPGPTAGAQDRTPTADQPAPVDGVRLSPSSRVDDEANQPSS